MSTSGRDRYIGEPDYPSPVTTAQPREGLRDIDEARIVSLAPDVCLTPVGSSVVPIPYPIVDYCGHDREYTPSVRFTRRRSMVLRSRTTHVHGDAAGTRKGIKSGTVESATEPVGHAAHVRAEGSPVIRHLDRFRMNDGNTVGEALFVRDTRTFPALVDDDPVPGSLVLVEIPSANPVQQPQSNAGTAAGSPPRPERGTTTTRPGGAATLARRGPWGAVLTVLDSIVEDFTMSPEERAVRVRAMRALFAGQQVVRDERLVGAKGVFRPSTIFDRETWEGKYGLAVVGRDEEIAIANDILTSMAGRAVDVRAATDEEVEGILEGRGVATPQDYAESKKNAEALRDAGVRVAAASLALGACLVGPYSLIKQVCPGEAHHIVPDMVYRTGRRQDTGGSSTDGRSLNAPTLNEGMTICLTPSMHGSGPTGIHGRLRAKFKQLEGTSPVSGTATMGSILAQSNAAIREIVGLPARCKAIAQAAATLQVRNKTGFAAPGRIKERPLPSPRAAEVMTQGHY